MHDVDYDDSAGIVDRSSPAPANIDTGGGVYDWLLDSEPEDETPTRDIDRIGNRHLTGHLHDGSVEVYSMTDATVTPIVDDWMRTSHVMKRQPSCPTCTERLDRIDGCHAHEFVMDLASDYQADTVSVSYLGTVGILELRGGGTSACEDAGYNEGNSESLADDQLHGSTGHGDDALACPKCHRCQPRSSDDWTLCSCGLMVCDACMTTGCPGCDAKLIEEPARASGSRANELTELRLQYSGIAAGHVRRMIFRLEHRGLRLPPDPEREHASWLEREIGQGAAGPSRPDRQGVTIAPWARIEGEVNGKRTRICPSCGGDFECLPEQGQRHHLLS